jgi:CubicO group peptidase (beta-lactamase class C family)
MPAANAITNAGALAKLYAATLGEVDGIRLLDDATREAASTSETPGGEPDLCLMVPTVFAKGFALPDPFSPFAGPGSYGHTGAGGSVAFAQPSRQLGFAYVMNKMNANLSADPRPQRMIDAAVKVIDAM